MGTGDRSYIYGENNGGSYSETTETSVEHKTHWDPRIEVNGIAGTVQVGIVPPSKKDSTGESGVWRNDDGQFLSLSRSGVNRLIVALREARDATYGRDE